MLHAYLTQRGALQRFLDDPRRPGNAPAKKVRRRRRAIFCSGKLLSRNPNAFAIAGYLVHVDPAPAMPWENFARRFWSREENRDVRFRIEQEKIVDVGVAERQNGFSVGQRSFFPQ